jgi:hypothetical protein
LLELLIAMVFVAVLAAGITLSLATCFKVWAKSLQAADLNQEARSVMAMLSRDIHGAYLGLDRQAGFFMAEPADASGAPVDSIDLCTESTSAARVALLPDELRSEWEAEFTFPATDYVGVQYKLRSATTDEPAGLYRTAFAAPVALRYFNSEQPPTEISLELISTRVVRLDLYYFDGEEWVRAWDSRLRGGRVPRAVFIDLTLRDERQRDHVFQTTVPIATS